MTRMWILKSIHLCFSQSNTLDKMKPDAIQDFVLTAYQTRYRSKTGLEYYSTGVVVLWL